jgi:L,D-peptidoglycan transpeptidase YkuD (ErfK/YbiS/YcfS/YnhG family)
MPIYKINDKDSNMSIEFEPKSNGLIQVVMSEPDNNYTGGCITIKQSDLKEIALAILKDKVME